MPNGPNTQWKVVLAIGALIPIMSPLVFAAVAFSSVATRLDEANEDVTELKGEISALRVSTQNNHDLLIQVRADLASHKRELDLRLRHLENGHAQTTPR